MAEHWTLEVADHIAAMTLRMRRQRVPERYIDQAVAKYLETVTPSGEPPFPPKNGDTTSDVEMAT